MASSFTGTTRRGEIFCKTKRWSFTTGEFRMKLRAAVDPYWGYL